MSLADDGRTLSMFQSGFGGSDRGARWDRRVVPILPAHLLNRREPPKIIALKSPPVGHRLEAASGHEAVQ